MVSKWAASEGNPAFIDAPSDAEDEVKALRDYDTVIVNQDFDAAVAQFAATVEARRTVSKG
jgi:guanylate kinase